MRRRTMPFILRHSILALAVQSSLLGCSPQPSTTHVDTTAPQYAAAPIKPPLDVTIVHIQGSPLRFTYALTNNTAQPMRLRYLDLAHVVPKGTLISDAAGRVYVVAITPVEPSRFVSHPHVDSSLYLLLPPHKTINARANPPRTTSLQLVEGEKYVMDSLDGRVRWHAISTVSEDSDYGGANTATHTINTSGLALYEANTQTLISNLEIAQPRSLAAELWQQELQEAR